MPSLMQTIFALFNFRCEEWEGGDRSITGQCITCNSEGALNPWLDWTSNQYAYCWYNLCDTAGYSISNSYCQIDCGNGTRTGYDVCTCDDSFKTWNSDSGYGCTCPNTAPVEGSSSCTAPSASQTVVELEESGNQIGFLTSSSTASLVVPYCGYYAYWTSSSKYVCKQPYCDSGYYLGLYGDELACLDNTSMGHTVSDLGHITTCSTSYTSRHIVAMYLQGGYYFTSCHTADTIDDALTPPTVMDSYTLDCTYGFISGAVYTQTELADRYDDNTFNWGLDQASAAATTAGAQGFWYLNFNSGQQSVGTYASSSAMTGNTRYGPDVIMKTVWFGSEVSWEIKYSGTTVCSGSGYSSSTYNVANCALTAGYSYTAYCYDSYGDGWHGGYLLVGDSKVCDETTSFSSKTEDFTFAARSSIDETNTGLENACLGTYSSSASGTDYWGLAITNYPSVNATVLTTYGQFIGAATDCSYYHCLASY